MRSGREPRTGASEGSTAADPLSPSGAAPQGASRPVSSERGEGHTAAAGDDPKSAASDQAQDVRGDRGVLSAGSVHVLRSEPFFCRDPFGDWISSILEDKEQDGELGT